MTNPSGKSLGSPRRVPAGAPPAAVSRATQWTRALALVLLTAVPMLPSLRAAFVYDDTTIIRDNAWLRGWGVLIRAWGQPYWPADNGIDVLGLYRPLHIALLGFVWNIGGGGARWFHLYALALGVSTVLAVWWMLGRSVRVTAAFVAAAWFATHPLHVEAISSVANTSELLVVLCTIALVRVLRSPSVLDGADDWKRAALVGVLAAAALSAKESGLLAVPIAAITAWGWREPRVAVMSLRDVMRANMRAWAAAAVGLAAVILARSVALGTPVAHASIAAQGLGALTGAERVRAMLSVWPRIAEMILWPVSLSPYYGPTIFPTNGASRAFVSALVVVLVLVAVVAIARRGDRRPAVALAWVALTYFPASNLAAPTGQILSDRTLFGATVGVALLLGVLLDRMPSLPRTVAACVCAVVIGRNMLMTTRYAVAWTSHRSLWTRMLEAAPDEHLGYKLLGIDARARGDTTRALAMLGRAFAMAPTDRQIRFEYGQVLYQAGRFGAAAATLTPLVTTGEALEERDFVALYLDAVGRSGGPAAVVQAATPLLHSQSASVAALYLGLAEQRLGRTDAADSAYALGLRRNPRDSVLRGRLDLLRGAGATPSGPRR
ncbi:MAG: tetratricopeptide repeat protein [bacterium]